MPSRLVPVPVAKCTGTPVSSEDELASHDAIRLTNMPTSARCRTEVCDVADLPGCSRWSRGTSLRLSVCLSRQAVDVYRGVAALLAGSAPGALLPPAPASYLATRIRQLARETTTEPPLCPLRAAARMKRRA